MIFIQKCSPSHHGTVALTRPTAPVFHFAFLLQQKREDLLVTTLRRSRRRSRLKVRLLGLVGPDPNSDQLLSEVQLHSKRTWESLQTSDRGAGGSGSGSGSGARSGSGSGSGSILGFFYNQSQTNKKPDLRLAG